jgi:hypothetical protein
MCGATTPHVDVDDLVKILLIIQTSDRCDLMFGAI